MGLLQFLLRGIQSHLRPFQGGGDVPAAVAGLLGILLRRLDLCLQLVLTLLRRFLRLGQLLVGGALGIRHFGAQSILLFLFRREQFVPLFRRVLQQPGLLVLRRFLSRGHFGTQLLLPLLGGGPDLIQLFLRSLLGRFHIRLHPGNFLFRRLLRGIHRGLQFRLALFGLQSGLFHGGLKLLLLLFRLFLRKVQPVLRLTLGFRPLEFRLPAVFLKGFLRVRQFGFQLLPVLRLLRQLGFRVQLGLGHFLDDDLADLHIGDVVVRDDFFLDFLDKLGLRHLFPLGRNLTELSGVSLQKAFEHGVVGNQIGEQLNLIFFVKFQRGVPLLDGVAHLIVAFQKLPELIAHPVIRVLHDGVGSLDGTANLGAALHDVAESAVAQGHDHPAHTVDAHKDLHIVAVVFREGLGVLDFHFQIVLNLFVGIIHGAVHFQGVAGLVAGGPEDDVGALIDEGHEPLN